MPSYQRVMKNLARPLLLCFAFCGYSGCADFPELNDRITDADRAADFPSLTNIDTILEGVPEPRAVNVAEDLDARVNGLKARAARLRGSVLTNSERLRLSSGVAVPASIR